MKGYKAAGLSSMKNMHTGRSRKEEQFQQRQQHEQRLELMRKRIEMLQARSRA